MKVQINTDKSPKAIGPYSQAIEVNGIIFVSGQIPINPKTNKLEKLNIAAQTEQVLENIKAILDKAGYTMSDVVKTTCLLSDMYNFKYMNDIYSKYFQNPFPARAAFAVKELPYNKKVLIEIDAVAVKGTGK